jgi:hypothetical protein
LVGSRLLDTSCTPPYINNPSRDTGNVHGHHGRTTAGPPERS